MIRVTKVTSPGFAQLKGTPQPIQRAEPSFLYQLDAPFEEGGCNLWSGNLQPNNNFDPKYAAKAAKLFAAAEDLRDALEGLVALGHAQDTPARRRLLTIASLAIAKSKLE